MRQALFVVTISATLVACATSPSHILTPAEHVEKPVEKKPVEKPATVEKGLTKLQEELEWVEKRLPNMENAK